VRVRVRRGCRGSLVAHAHWVLEGRATYAFGERGPVSSPLASGVLRYRVADSAAIAVDPELWRIAASSLSVDRCSPSWPRRPSFCRRECRAIRDFDRAITPRTNPISAGTVPRVRSRVSTVAPRTPSRAFQARSDRWGRPLRHSECVGALRWCEIHIGCRRRSRGRDSGASSRCCGTGRDRQWARSLFRCWYAAHLLVEVVAADADAIASHSGLRHDQHAAHGIKCSIGTWYSLARRSAIRLRWQARGSRSTHSSAAVVESSRSANSSSRSAVSRI
jgi:hypothetical protein